MNPEKLREAINWYEENREQYENLVVILKELLEDILAYEIRRHSKKIDYYCIHARCKSVASLRDKLRVAKTIQMLSKQSIWMIWQEQG